MTDRDDTPRGWVRALWPGEEERLVAHLLRLDPEDRHSRFLGHADEEHVRRHVERARTQRWQAIGWFEGGVLRAAVEIAFVGDEAEAALTTEPGYRRRGIAGRLLERAARRAALAGATRLVLCTRRSNTAMVGLARAAGMLCRDEAGEVVAERALERPDPLSDCGDIVEERQGQIAGACPAAAQARRAMLPER